MPVRDQGEDHDRDRDYDHICSCDHHEDMSVDDDDHDYYDDMPAGDEGTTTHASRTATHYSDNPEE